MLYITRQKFKVKLNKKRGNLIAHYKMHERPRTDPPREEPYWELTNLLYSSSKDKNAEAY